jgi:hypothetical protein
VKLSQLSWRILGAQPYPRGRTFRQHCRKAEPSHSRARRCRGKQTPISGSAKCVQNDWQHDRYQHSALWNGEFPRPDETCREATSSIGLPVL